MTISKSEFAILIKQFKFRELFNEMGWDNDRTTHPIIVDNFTYTLQSVAQKSNFRIMTCSAAKDGRIPNYVTRRKIDQRLSKFFHEHLIIFFDNQKNEQLWQYIARRSGKPAQLCETRYQVNQDPEMLYQRTAGLIFTLDEEDHITIVDVTNRVTGNLAQNAEKVTKKFYEGFRKEHKAFLDFISGIDDIGDKEWYASLMLNRLMFCYFIQKKGFLDGNKNYLADKLIICKERNGKNKFYSFYRNFLIQLFHKWLGEPEHDKELLAEFGHIPYLNGGLFDEHELEKLYINIDIQDKAFERIFTFFDQYEWHLDIRGNVNGREINPDVIGYIFEKYINERAQMGAYYTKEDITDYISKNCIIPWLFEETERKYPAAFSSDGPIWTMLQNSHDTYLHDATKKGVPSQNGVFEDLPEEIKRGLAFELEQQIVDGNGPWLFKLREEWNKPASQEIALPTETWRELIDRRKHYLEVVNKICSGKITKINDFITYNLNIRSFAQDIIESSNDPELILHFYKSLTKITILDPTCGSGAFLFAALNILEPLYEGCLLRMRAFIEDEDIRNSDKDTTFQNKFKDFRKILGDIQHERHPNWIYFIYKTIILNNLYGVDIMEEAVEIAKLRLFLKLASTVDVDMSKPNAGLEPLPDLDFNIRAGNTLVGFATSSTLYKNLESDLINKIDLPQIIEKCNDVAHAFSNYKKVQLDGAPNHRSCLKIKNEMKSQIEELRTYLNILLHKQFYSSIEPERWYKIYQPYHWFAEFYEIINEKGGFDVIIGNPPYIKTSKIDYILAPLEYQSLSGRNIYSAVIERALSLGSVNSYIGMITPVSVCSGIGFSPIMKLLFTHGAWVSSYSNRPGKLFEGVEQRLTIFIHSRNESPCFTSPYQHWYSEEREILFSKLTFYDAPKLGLIPLKAGSTTAANILRKIICSKKKLDSIFGNSGECWYHDGPTYWIRSLPFFPLGNESGNSSHYHCIKGKNLPATYFIISVLASSTFYMFYKASSNCRDFGVENISALRINESLFDLEKIIKEYGERLKKTAVKCTRLYPSGLIEYDEYYPSKAKDIIDRIDLLLAAHYGFTQEELDFIINYDIKYRMGKEMDVN